MELIERMRYRNGRVHRVMPHQFDPDSFGQVLRDTCNVRDRAAALERTLGSLVAIDAKPTTSGGAGEWAAAYEASREQARVADRVLRRLIGPLEGDLGARSIVLVVDDNSDVRDATALLLEQAGFRAITAANGVEALIVAHYAQPAVALLDLMMPVLDGLQTARLLSESPSTRHVRVVAYSGRADMFSRRLPGTFTAILSKPTTPEELLALVREQTATFGNTPGLA